MSQSGSGNDADDVSGLVNGMAAASLTSLKADGNAAFKAGDWPKAVELYTAALETNPVDSEAAALYSNRAAALLKMPGKADLGE